MQTMVSYFRSSAYFLKFLIVFGAITFFFPELILALGRTALVQVPREVSFMTRTILGGGGLLLACVGLILAMMDSKSAQTR